MADNLEELTLLMLSLSSWEENQSGNPVRRAWKGYQFEVLDKLGEAGLISQKRGAKSVYLTDEGVRKAEELKARFGLAAQIVNS